MKKPSSTGLAFGTGFTLQAAFPWIVVGLYIAVFIAMFTNLWIVPMMAALFCIGLVIETGTFG